MERSVKAALLSALVFPGAGQLYLRLRARALLFIVPALGAVGYFLAQVWDLVNLISAEIVAGRVGLDPVAIAQRVELQAGPAGGLMDAAVIVMIVCWVASTVDAYLQGRRQPSS